MPILETTCASLGSKGLAYLITALGLATAGAVDGVNVAFNHKSMLAETGLPFEGQIGLGAIFLLGFVAAAKLFLDSQNQKFEILSKHIERQEVEKKEQLKAITELKDAQIAKLESEKATLINKLTSINDDTRKQLQDELHRK